MQTRFAQFFLVIGIISLIIFFASWESGNQPYLPACLVGTITFLVAVFLFVRSYAPKPAAPHFESWRRWRSKRKK